MKVILVSRCAWTLYNFRAGLIRALVDRGVEVICGGSAGDGFEVEIERLGASFRSLPCDGGGISPRADLRFLGDLYGWYRRERPDVIHHFTVKPVIYGSAAARLAVAPRIINTVTGLGYAFTGRRPWLRRVVECEYRLALRGAHLTFFQNAEDRDLFVRKRLVCRERTALVPGSGIDISRFSGSCIAARPSANPGEVSFLMVARLLRDKGVYEYVEAARVVKKAFPAASFYLLGWPDARNPSSVSQDEIEGWQREGLIRWLGRSKDVRSDIAASDVVVLPSYREGSPRSLLEGAAMGKPLIATDTVGCREVVDHGQNGLLVPVGDSCALAEAMICLIKDPGLREGMGKAGRRKVEQEFDEQVVIRETFAAYGIPPPS